MKKLKVKFMAMVLIAVLIALIIPVNVLAAEGNTENENIQIVKAQDGRYIIYVKGLENTEFKYKIGEDEETTYVNSKEDEETNYVVLITAEDAKDADGKTLYIKTSEGETSAKLNLGDTFVFNQTKMDEVGKTTKRISTEPTEKEIPTTETLEDGTTKNIKTTIGGLKITEEGKSYKYAIAPVNKDTVESELMELARTLENTNKFNELSKYEKIETQKRFYDLYNSIKDNQAKWNAVENKEVWQPDTSKSGDEYIVFLKEVDEKGKEKIADAKFMVADRKDADGVNTTSQVVETKRTSKLPITGDSIILFAILAVIILIAIIVFIKMKKMQGKTSKH